MAIGPGSSPRSWCSRGPSSRLGLLRRASPARTSSATSASSTRSGAVAAEAGATPPQVALAWLLAQGDDIAPIPGTRRVARVEENTAADAVELSKDQIARLDDLTPAAGSRHDEANMATIDR